MVTKVKINPATRSDPATRTHKKMKIIFLDIIIFGSKVIFFKFLSYYIDYIVGSTLSFFYQNGPWGGRYHCSKDEH